MKATTVKTSEEVKAFVLLIFVLREMLMQMSPALSEQTEVTGKKKTT